MTLLSLSSRIFSVSPLYLLFFFTSFEKQFSESDAYEFCCSSLNKMFSYLYGTLKSLHANICGDLFIFLIAKWGYFLQRAFVA